MIQALLWIQVLLIQEPWSLVPLMNLEPQLILLELVLLLAVGELGYSLHIW